MKVRLALYRPHRWQDIGGYVIAWWTRSAYSHCELVIDGWCYSSSIRDGGVSRERIARLWSRKITVKFNAGTLTFQIDN